MFYEINLIYFVPSTGLSNHRLFRTSSSDGIAHRRLADIIMSSVSRPSLVRSFVLERTLDKKFKIAANEITSNPRLLTFRRDAHLLEL
jgi:hypothetical protein